MDESYGCDHAWVFDHADRTGVERDRHGQRVARLISKHWICRKCRVRNVTVTREDDLIVERRRVC